MVKLMQKELHVMVVSLPSSFTDGFEDSLKNEPKHTERLLPKNVRQLSFDV